MSRMSRVMACVVCVAVVLSMATQVFATQPFAANQWINTTMNGKWSTAANWSRGYVPGLDTVGDFNDVNNVWITGKDANACVIDGTQPHAQCWWMHVGVPSGATLNVNNGGKIGDPNYEVRDKWAGSAYIGGGVGVAGGVGVVNIDGAGSVATFEGWNVGFDVNTGVVNVTNGGLMRGMNWGNYVRNTGKINLASGGNAFFQNLSVDEGGLVDIHPGSELILDGNQVLYAVNELIGRGKVAGNGVFGDVVATFSETFIDDQEHSTNPEDGNNTHLVCQASGDTVWINGTLDGKWSTAANWSTGRVPVQVADGNGMVKIGLSGGRSCVIDGTQPQARCKWLYVGSFGSGTLKVVADGNLGIPLFGPDETFLGTGINAGVIEVDGAGSIARSEGWRIGGALGGGGGTLNITNGGYAIAGSGGTNIYATGTVNLIGGSMFIEGNSVPPGSELTIDEGGLIDIQVGATLILKGDQRTLINGFIASGKIRGNGAVGKVGATFNGTNTLVVYQVPPGQQLMSLKKGVTFDRQFHQIPVDSNSAIQVADVQLIKRIGVNFAKLLFNPYCLIKGSTIDDTNMLYVVELVNKFVNNGVPVVVCIHPEPAFKSTYLGSGGANFPALLGFYQDFAAYLATRWGRGEVAFELMTEPNSNYTSWNTMLSQMRQAARNGMPDNILILDALGGTIDNLILLTPEADANVYYSFTTYAPHEFTWQGAYWIGTPPASSIYPYLSKVPYPSTGEEKAGDYIMDIPEGIDPDGTLHDAAVAAVNAYLDTPWDSNQQKALFAPITTWKNAHTPKPKVFCAEWGVLDSNQAFRMLGPTKPGAVETDRIQFIKDRRLALEDANISWAYWSFNEAFTILDPVVRLPLNLGPPTSWLDNPTLDALGLPLCGCHCKLEPSSPYDMNKDCYVTISDLAIFANTWVDCTDPCSPSCSP